MKICDSRTCEHVGPGRPKKWPIRVRVGRVEVAVYRVRGKRPRFVFSDYSSGKRVLWQFTDETEAVHQARLLASRLNAGQEAAAQMTNADAYELQSARSALGKFGLRLSDGVRVLAACLAKLGGDAHELEAAVRWYVQTVKGVSKVTVEQVIDEIVKSKTALGRSARYLGDLRSRLGILSKAFPSRVVGTITPVEVQRWLDGLAARGLKAQTVAHARRIASLVFRFAYRRGYTAIDVMARVEPVSVRRAEPQVFTPEEMARLMAAADSKTLPVLALLGFAGIRPAEVERLDWSAINLADRVITIGADAAKTGSRRFVEIAPNLAKWLLPYARASGPVWAGPRGTGRLQQALSKIAERAGVTWKPNALRHTFISCRVALVQDVPKVAFEAGNSPQMIMRHYLRLTTAETARRWFSIEPQTAENVVALSGGAQ